MAVRIRLSDSTAFVVDSTYAELHAAVQHAMLRGTLRDHVTQKRRAMVRFFACQDDVSNDSPDAPLPARIVSGEEPFFIIGAIAGG